MCVCLTLSCVPLLFYAKNKIHSDFAPKKLGYRQNCSARRLHFSLVLHNAQNIFRTNFGLAKIVAYAALASCVCSNTFEICARNIRLRPNLTCAFSRYTSRRNDARAPCSLKTNTIGMSDTLVFPLRNGNAAFLRKKQMARFFPGVAFFGGIAYLFSLPGGRRLAFFNGSAY